jgi:hypothetical protein
VENNLLSGRQYIANEPPLSDTSDSEGRLYCFTPVCVVGLARPSAALAFVSLPDCRSEWPRGLRHELSSLARTLGPGASNPAGGVYVCVVLCVGGGLATG